MAFVIKIKYEDNLRRLTVPNQSAGEALISFAQLESKVRELFELQASDQLVVTYTDRDNDVVTMTNDLDVVDALVYQSLNPLRVNVTLKSIPGPNPLFEGPENVAQFSGLVEEAMHDVASKVEEAMHDAASKVAEALENGADAAAAFSPSGWAPGSSAQHEQPGSTDVNMEGPRDDGVIHHGVGCDVCQMNPIVGNRWKSTKKPDYDLCSKCFEKEGNKNEYMKIEQPMFRRGMMRTAPGMGAIFHPTGPNVYMGRPFGMRGRQGRGFFAPMRGFAGKLDARFVRDVTMFDGTEVAPGTPFTKIWRLRNNGTVSWPAKTNLVFVGGDGMGQLSTAPIEIPEQGLAPECEMEVSVDLVAPGKPGRYVSHWRLASADGHKFGHRIWVHIQVVPGESLDQPAVPMEDTPTRENEIHGNPSVAKALEGGQGTTTAVGVDTTKMDEAVTHPVLEPMATSKVDVSMNEAGEAPHPSPRGLAHMSASQTSLAQLKSMGFSDEKLNAELLRKNGMDLPKTLDDLCSAEKWGPVLEELEKMGFSDSSTNKRIMFKRNGVLKLVVKDLVQMYKEAQGKGKKSA